MAQVFEARPNALARISVLLTGLICLCMGLRRIFKGGGNFEFFFGFFRYIARPVVLASRWLVRFCNTLDSVPLSKATDLVHQQSWSPNMQMPKYDPETYHPQQSYSAKQLSRYDMQVAGVVIYVVAMTVFFVVALVMMLFWNETAVMAHAQSAKRHPVTQVRTAEQAGRIDANRP